MFFFIGRKEGDDMPEYKNRFPEDRQKQDAYENACDYLAYSEDRWSFCGLELHVAMKVWWQALIDMKLI